MPAEIARASNDVFDAFVEAADAGDQARMRRLVREQFELVKQHREQSGNSLSETVVLQSLEVRALHMQVRRLSDRVSELEDHLTRPSQRDETARAESRC